MAPGRANAVRCYRCTAEAAAYRPQRLLGRPPAHGPEEAWEFFLYRRAGFCLTKAIAKLTVSKIRDPLLRRSTHGRSFVILRKLYPF